MTTTVIDLRVVAVHRATGRELGVVTRVGRNAVRFVGDGHPHGGLAAHGEVEIRRKLS